MTTVTTPPETGRAASGGPARRRHRFSSWLSRHAGARLAGLLSAPMLWLVVAYLGALGVLLVSSFWTIDDFTGQTVHDFSLANFKEIFTTEVYRSVTLRSVGVAAGVTIICMLFAVPMAFYMAKVASRQARRWLVIAILTPLWASYLVKVYAWRVMLANGGVLDWILGGNGRSPGYGLAATVIVLSYLWLPYMILPVYAGFERMPDSLLEASADLGARAGRTFRSVVLPTIVPAVVAGSIFTFSLSLGDYITVEIVGGRYQLLGNVVYRTIGTGGNVPFAAAVAAIPVIIMVIYLLAVRRTGALEEL